MPYFFDTHNLCGGTLQFCCHWLLDNWRQQVFTYEAWDHYATSLIDNVWCCELSFFLQLQVWDLTDVIKINSSLRVWEAWPWCKLIFYYQLRQGSFIIIALPQWEELWIQTMEWLPEWWIDNITKPQEAWHCSMKNKWWKVNTPSEGSIMSYLLCSRTIWTNLKNVMSKCFWSSLIKYFYLFVMLAITSHTGTELFG